MGKSSRHAKIIGNFGEQFVCNWLSRSGWEVVPVDHTGIDLIAYNRKLEKRIGITVKSRTRIVGTENDPVNIFKNQRDDRGKVEQACEDFACEPYIGVYVETDNFAELYLTSLINYDEKYKGALSKVVDTWKMGEKYRQQYACDSKVHHIQFKIEETNWTFEVV